MRLGILTSAASLLVSCGNDPRKNEQNREVLVPLSTLKTKEEAEAYLSELRRSNPGLTESCIEKMRSDQLGAFEFINNPACFEMQPRRRWTGVWNKGWEWTSFCEGSGSGCPIASERGATWLTFADGARPRWEPKDGLHRVEFVGRRSAAPGNFGHLGQYDHLMVVDQLISIAPLRKAPKEE